MTANKVKVRKIDEDESQMDDDEKINREYFTYNCHAISSIKSVPTNGAGVPYLSQENAGFFFLVK